MFSAKLVVTLFVTLAILVVFLFSSPQVGSFFTSTGGRITDFLSPQDNIERNVSFSLKLPIYEGVNATARNSNIFISSKIFSATVKDGALDTTGGAKILGYSGRISVTGDIINLDGQFKKIELKNTSLSFAQGPVDSSTFFDSVTIENLTLKEFKSNTGGTIFVNGGEMRIEGAIEITSPQGNFSFDGGLTIAGRAAKIYMPEAKITIG